LGVVGNKLERPAADTAGLVDLLGCELDRMHLADGGGREVAGLVLQYAELDRTFCEGSA
jgi:hypothetical protein